MTEIKPCPFCGSDCTEIGYWSYVVCRSCDASGPTGQSEERAIELWNKANKEPAIAPGKGKQAYLWAVNEVLEGREVEWKSCADDDWDAVTVALLPPPDGLAYPDEFEARKPLSVYVGIDGAKWAVEQLLTGNMVEWTVLDGDGHWVPWGRTQPTFGDDHSTYRFRLAQKESK